MEGVLICHFQPQVTTFGRLHKSRSATCGEDMGHAPWHFILKYKGPWACLQRQGTFIRERQKCGTFRASVTLVVRHGSGAVRLQALLLRL